MGFSVSGGLRSDARPFIFVKSTKFFEKKFGSIKTIRTFAISETN